MRVWQAIIVAFLTGLVLCRTALAGDPEGNNSTSAEAKALRSKARDHFNKQEYAQAVDNYQKALLLEPRFGTMAQMASALKELGRYDDALNWYERALGEFANALPKDRKHAEDEKDALLAKVGMIVVEGDIVKGARLVIDERDVGRLPLQGNLRVLAGFHEVREESPGFAPISTTVDVRPGQTAIAQLVAKKRQGRLDIHEKHNWIMQVELDGENIGLSPITTTVTAGEHRIRLHGYMRPEALLACEAPEVPAIMGARMESDEKTVTVGLFETQVVELAADDMDSALRVDSTPRGAIVKIDRSEVGSTPWEGRLPLGEHSVEVVAAGFYSTKQLVRLERRKSQDLALVLEREADRAAEARAAKNLKIELGLAFGTGVIGLGLFAITGGLALQDINVLQAKCEAGGQCPSTENERVKRLQKLGTVSTVGLIVGGLAMGSGATLLFLNRPEERKGPKMPVVRVGLGNVVLEGRF